ncbi:uncharacterized protein LOC131208582 [Anopheles bellator]|uniref:uncharacterized protein LOC131208582 n=1 Tax=Anopheles bellator TaxID=139047 RepID=UPI00264989A5|nr:uncharacterized protein LOC131208582 [Anopheles bellator]
MNTNLSIGEEADRILIMKRSVVPGHRLHTRSNSANGTQNVLLKVLNREHSGYFTTGLNRRYHEEPFQEVPGHLQFCLKDIVPYCYLNNHIFMGLTSCGQFLLSYRLSYDYEEVLTNGLHFRSNHKYELFFWIYRPHMLLSKYFQVCLFDDHGVDEIKNVSITQWKTDSGLLIVHGGNMNEESDSYVTMVRVPKLGCLDCRVVRDAHNGDEERQDILCIGCNMTIHMKYRSTEAGPGFNPKFNLNCPGYIIMSENSFIHTIHVSLDVQSKKLAPTVSLSSKFLGKAASQSAGVVEKSSGGFVLDKYTTAKPASNFSGQWKKSEEAELVPTANPEVEMSIAEQIIADFAEYETDLYETKCSIRNYPDNFDELIITSPASVNNVMSEATSELPSAKVQLMNHLNNTNIELRLDNGSQDAAGATMVATSSTAIPRTVSSLGKDSPLGVKSYVTRIDLQSGDSTTGTTGNRPANDGLCDIPITATSSTTTTNPGLSALRRRFVLSDTAYVPSMQGPPQQAGPVSDANLEADPAAKAYEFSEDNERCEKISAFRKRRLADKKYEFSEDNISEENIEPFNRLRSQIRGRVPTPGYSPSHHHGTGYADIMPTAHHLHRASPNHGFRSPCGSPVGNRYLRSPPGIRSPSYYRHRSPVSHASSVANGLFAGAAAAKQQQLLKKVTPLDPRDYVHFLSSGATGSGLNENTCSGGPGVGTPDIPKVFLDAIHRLNEKKLATEQLLCVDEAFNNENNINCDNQLPPVKRAASEISLTVNPKASERPTCSKKIVKIYVEEDDANSVVTMEDDDCISPGYHTSLPMEVHGSCYSNMQIISQASYSKLNCAAVIVTQNSFDMEMFSVHVANHICTQDSKKYDFLLDSAYELTHVCPLTETITCTMVLQFTANDVDSSKPQHCKNCSGTIDCQTHRKVYQCRSLFTWCVTSGEWSVLDYGNLCSGPYLNMKKLTSNYNRLLKKLRRFTKKLFVNGGESEANRTYDYLQHLRVHDSDVSKTKQRLVDLENMIEFYRRHPGEREDEFSASDFDSYGEEEEDEDDDDGDSSADSTSLVEGTSIASDTVSDEDDLL